MGAGGAADSLKRGELGADFGFAKLVAQMLVAEGLGPTMPATLGASLIWRVYTGFCGTRFALLLRRAGALEFPKGGSGHDPHAEE